MYIYISQIDQGKGENSRIKMHATGSVGSPHDVTRKLAFGCSLPQLHDVACMK